MMKVILFVCAVFVSYYMTRLGQHWGVVQDGVRTSYDILRGLVLLLFLGFAGLAISEIFVTRFTLLEAGNEMNFKLRFLQLWSAWGLTIFAIAFGICIPSAGANPFNWISTEPDMLLAFMAFAPLFILAVLHIPATLLEMHDWWRMTFSRKKEEPQSVTILQRRN